MKNNSKILILAFFSYFLFFQNITLTDEIIFNTLELNITENGSTINAGAGSAYSKDDDIKINAKSFNYNKISSILKAKSGFAILSKKKIKISADRFIYNSNLSTFRAIGNVEINDSINNIIIRTEEASYNKDREVISSAVKSNLIDRFNNNFFTDDFFYTLNDNLVKITNAKIINIENDILQIEKAYINLLTNKLIGKDIAIDFNSNDFNKDNEPRIKGKTVVSDQQITLVEKGVFTTCKKTDDCPPWQFFAKKITHDKKKKTISYNNAWLKIYDKPVFYFPRFFHPDPTVKRQSGFLMPSFANSNSTGTAFALPYFHVISENKDLTFSPRFYSTDKLLTQYEYRAINDNAKHDLDFSLLNEKNLSSKSHFFSNSLIKLDFQNFDDTALSLQLQNTTSDTYLRKYKLKSPLINSDTNTLISSLNFSANRDDLSVETEFVTYKNLSKLKDSDKYEYIYPNYNIRKDLDTNLQEIGNFSLNSSGYIKNYNTNVFERVVINDFLFSSYPKFTNSGLKNSYNFLIKNINTDSDNSKEYKEEVDTKIATLIEFNSSYPLKKKTDDFTNIFKPIISARYSPNNSKNTKNDNRRIDMGNIFSLNRLGTNDSVEGGGSLSIGSEFYKTDLNERDVFVGKIANVLKLKDDNRISANSSLNKKTSNIVGNIIYNPNEYFKLNYDFAQNQNIKKTEYQSLKNEFRVNNFVSTFEYLNENNTKQGLSYLSNKTIYNIDETRSFAFETRENKKTNATEFYNLIYEYKNDCLTAAIQYNRDYYTDRDIKPNESVYLKLTMFPFGETKSPNLSK